MATTDLMSFMFAVIVLLASVSSMVNGHYQDSTNSSPKYPAYVEPPKKSPPPPVSCQALTQLCASQAPYTCCEGTVCRATEVTGDHSVCLPPIVPKIPAIIPHAKCRQITELCEPYGPYTCCEGLGCLSGSPNHPPGIGVCAPLAKDANVMQQCQKKLQACENYGSYKCCDGLHCTQSGVLPNPFFGIDTSKLPPGIGLCSPFKL